MNKIFSSVLIGAIASTMSLSAATAVVGEDVPSADRLSKLFINETATTYNDDATLGGENESSYDHNVSIDLPGFGQPVQIVWQPFVNLTTDSKFNLRVINGDFVLARDVVLCSGTVKVGSMVSVGDTDGDTIMNNMSFQMSDTSDAAEADIAKDNNITFAAGTTCEADAPLLQVTSTEGACTNLSIEIPQAIDNSSQAFTDYTAPAITIGKTQRLVKIACDVPVCTIDAGNGYKTFTNVIASSGINNAKTQAVGSTDVSEYCPECDNNTNAVCVTTISVENNATFDITSLEITPAMANNLGMTVDVAFDGNTTETGKALNSLITVSEINISTDEEEKITITYRPTENAVIEEGVVSSAITLKSDGKALTVDARRPNELAKFSAAGNTVFTVPYMNTSYKSMVKITSLSDATATLSAVITDQDGVSTGTIDLGTINPKATKFLFSTSGPLKDAADAAGIKNAWSVVFTMSAEATVVATMVGPDGGDRAITVF